MDIDTMDIDMDPPRSSAKRGPSFLSRTSSESSAKSINLHIPDEQCYLISEYMSNESDSFGWLSIFNKGSEDPEKMTQVLSAAVAALTDALSTTVAKATFLAPMTVSQAKRFVRSFNTEERNEWVVGLRKGLEGRDWTDLIIHRAYYS